MKATDIEFAKLVGIKQSGGSVSLEYKKDVQNHINTIHASAQFTKKGRASLSVAVEIKDSEGVCTAQGTFGWFISKI